MTYAITIRAANHSGHAIRRLWDDVSEFETAPSMQKLDYAPHITLGIYETVGPELLYEAVDEIFAELAALTLCFKRLSVFDGQSPVLWAVPVASETLALLSQKLHALIDPELCHRHYRPNAWRPHCTLGTDIRPEYADAARDFARRRVSLFEVIFDRADCVAFPPVKILKSTDLSAASRS